MSDIILYLQIACIFFPIIVVFTILSIEHNRTAAYLMIASISCILANACGYMLLKASSYGEALIVFKLEYMSNVLFLLFYTIFIISYLRMKVPGLIINLFAFFYMLDVSIMWSSKIYYLITRNRDYAVGRFLGREIGYISFEPGYIYHLRIASFCIIHLFIWGYIIWRITKTNRKEIVKNYSRLMVADMVIIGALLYYNFFGLRFDITPMAASISSIIIAFGVIKARLFKISELGRGWLLENMSDAYIIVDDEYGYLDSNKAANQMFPDLVYLRKHQSIPEAIKAIFNDSGEHYFLNGNTYTKQVEKLSSPKLKPNKQGEIAIEGYSIVFSDITNLRALYDEVNAAREKAEEESETKSAFMSNMSHEIRTPMNAIVGMTEIMLRRDLPQAEKGYLRNIKNSGEALVSIINDILDFSKIEAGRMELVDAEYEPMVMLNDLSMIFLNRIGEKNIELIFDVAPDIPSKLLGDNLRLRQIIINLVNNAIKFTEDGFVSLTVRVESVNENKIELYFSVKDSGQGIKEEDMNKLFRSFSQVDSKKNRAKEGTGLGLAIAKQLVELMGGNIGVRSVYGAGTEFYFNIFQEIVDASPATGIYARIKDDDGKERMPIVSSNLEGIYEKNIRKLCDYYNLDYIDYQTLECSKSEKGLLNADYFFSDIETYKMLRERVPVPKEMKICILQNPMLDHIEDSEVTFVNKPLFSFNFCCVINNEIMDIYSAKEETTDFIAPEAKILIVDDNDMNLKVATGLLQPYEMLIDTANSGQMAIELCRKRQYHIIFMDHMMPVMDGIEATHKIREINAYYMASPIIALTANAVSGASEMYKKEGLNDFVAKPIEMKEISSKIKHYLPKKLIKSRKESGIMTDDMGELLVIEGLDVESGIKYSGSKEMFLSLLGDYYKIIDIKAKLIRELLEEGRIKDYTVEVHALKNTSRMIGAPKLSDDFYMLEKAGNEKNVDLLMDKTEEVLKLFESYKPILKPFGALRNGSKEATNEELESMLLDITKCMDEFDLDGADATLRELEEYKIPTECEEKFELLRVYVADVDNEKTAQTVNELIEILRQSN